MQLASTVSSGRDRGVVIREQIAAAKFAIGERNLHQSNFCGKISWACGFPWMD